ncbi:MAG: TIGR01906 family membrane protein [Bacilli bacterium]|nr:TIGR01906 family membrane protein [Bacilli bacterium]
MSKKRKALFVVVSIIYTMSLVVFAITLSINLPIYFRPFYYMLMGPLHVVDDLNNWTGGSFTRNDVIEAYNEVLNFCCFFTKFGTGKLAWSEEGMNHFKDCQGLFLLDTVLMLVSGALIGGIHILKKKNIITPYKHCHLIAGISTIVLPLVIGGLASIDFDKAFVIFHHIFFPGKENWIFDQNKDQIILVLPENFFMACAIFIGVGAISISTYYIIRGILTIRKNKKAKA